MSIRRVVIAFVIKINHSFRLFELYLCRSSKKKTLFDYESEPSIFNGNLRHKQQQQKTFVELCILQDSNVANSCIYLPENRGANLQWKIKVRWIVSLSMVFFFFDTFSMEQKIVWRKKIVNSAFFWLPTA